MDDELAFFLMFNDAGSNELLHHVGGQCAGLVGFLKLQDLLLEDLNLDVFLGSFLLLLQLRFLVGLDLGHSSAPLTGRLQHVRGDALAHWNDREQSQSEDRSDTYERCGCCSKISAP